MLVLHYVLSAIIGNTRYQLYKKLQEERDTTAYSYVSPQCEEVFVHTTSVTRVMLNSAYFQDCTIQI